MKTFKALVKREYWEHRGGIYLTPLIMAAVLAGLMILGSFSGNSLNIDDINMSLSFSEKNNQAIEQLETLSESKREKLAAVMLNVPTMIFGFVLLIVSLFYALGSLYDERKDRSILFWKSLPISDTQTVLSKLFTVVVLAPALYFIAIAAFQIFIMIYASVSLWLAGGSVGLMWGSANVFTAIIKTLFSLVAASLWLAPVWGWCMLASAWAKRVAFLWGVLPILMAFIGEAILFKSSRFAEIVFDHIGQAFIIQNSFINEVADYEMLGKSDVITASSMLTNNNFWIGILVAAIFVMGAIYTRRFRDES